MGNVISNDDIDPKNPKKKSKLFLSYDECLARLTEVAGPVSREYLQTLANKKGTFKAGKRANSPLPKLYPVDRESFEQWLSGHGNTRR